MSLWLDTSSNSNNIKQSYVHGFLDISGGNVNIRANNNLNIFSGTDTSTSRFTLSSDEIRVYDDDSTSFVDLSNNKLQYIKDVSENIQTRLTDLTSRTKKIRTTTGGDIEVSANIIPSVANTINLGSVEKPFGSIYLNSSTLHFIGDDSSESGAISIDTTGEVYINKDTNNERRLINQSKSDNNKTKIGFADVGGDGTSLDVSGHAYFRDNVRIIGDLDVSGNINFLGEFIQKDTVITVTEQMDLSNNGTGPALIVRQHGSEAIASFYDDNEVAMIINDGGDVSMNMKLNVGGTTTVSGATILTSTLNVSNTANMSSNAIVSGDVSLNSKLSVGSDVSLNSNVDIQGNMVVSGNITGNYPTESIPSTAINGGLPGAVYVSLIDSNGDISNEFSVTKIRFDTDSGFAIDNLSNNAVKVKMNSTFKYWNVEGQTSLVAEGLDTMDFFTDGNIQIVTDGSDANHITFNAPNMVDSSANQDISGIKTFQQIFVYDDVCMNSNLKIIGNADIGGTLDVSGDITGVTDLNVTGYSYLDDVEMTGNLGIKTTEAAVYELEVNGTAYASDISAGSSIKVGNTSITSTATSLGGTPTAPTANPGTNNTQIATTQFVQTSVANLVDSAPTALDTLNELAAALGDDANFSTTITTRLGNVDVSVNALESTTATHTSDISVLDTSVNALESTTATHTSNISVLDTSVNALETTTATHTSNISVLDASVNVLESTTATHTSNISVLDTSVNALESTTATHTSDISVLDTSVNALESTTATHTSNISVLDT